LGGEKHLLFTTASLANCISLSKHGTSLQHDLGAE